MKIGLAITQLSVGLAVALAACLTPSAQADPILFNPSGGASTPAYNITGLGFGAGNALAVNAITPGVGLTVGAQFTIYYQTHLTSLTGPNAPAAVPGLNSTFQVTEVAAFTERVTSLVTVPGHGTTATFAVVPSASARINIYESNAVVFNDAAGTGFTAGNLIASFNPTSFNSSQFTDTTTNAGGPNSTVAFNRTGAGNGLNATADVGSGSTNLNAATLSYNTAFFQPPTGLPLIATSLVNSNLSSSFDSVSPSLLFTNPLTGTSFAPNIGSNNGTSGPDFQLQVSGFTESFGVVPEPASVAMTVLGLVGAGLGSLVVRRRQARASA